MKTAVPFILTLAAIALVALLAPVEQTLGPGIRLVYFHGAWVWAGIVVFGLAALAGAVGLAGFTWRAKVGEPRRATRSSTPPDRRSGSGLARLSLALGRVGLFYWLTYLPLSLLVMRQFWGGFFFAEPRWRIPFTFAVVAVLLQIGLAVMNHPRIACAGNLLFGIALYTQLLPAGSVLHPESPVFGSGSLRIELFFVALLALSLLFAAQLSAWLYRRSARHA